MAAAQPAEAKQLRLFATLDGKQQAADGSAGGGGGKPAAPAVGAVTNPQQRLELLAAGSSSKWSPFYAVSARHDMHTTALLTHCISLGHQSSGQLAGFDRDLSRCGGCEAGSQDGQLAAALAEQLVPGWRALTRTPGWRWHLQARPGEPNNPLHCPSRVPSQPPRHRPRSCQPTGSYENMKFAWLSSCAHPAALLRRNSACLQNLMESPCFGVPGICRYTAARAAWLAGQLRQGIEEDACRQGRIWACACDTGGDPCRGPPACLPTFEHWPQASNMPPTNPPPCRHSPAASLQAGGGPALRPQHLVPRHVPARGAGGLARCRLLPAASRLPPCASRLAPWVAS